MTDHDITDNNTDDLDQRTENATPSSREADPATNPKRKPRSILDNDSSAASLSNTGGLDSLGGGRLP